MSLQVKEAQVVVRNIYVCYFLSGAAGLVYQVLWLRKLLLVFGSTVHAVSAVLTVFFGGLALGSWWFGRLIDRRERAGLRWYAGLEAAVGLYAFITLPLFDAIQHLYIPMYRASGFSPNVLAAASFACSALILLVPTTLLGGTFPVLSRFLIRSSGERGVKIAGLYGINTAGAMAGTLLVYYVGLPVLGVFRSLLCAGVINLGIGMLCLTFDRHLESLGFASSSKAPDTPVAVQETPGIVQALFVGFGLSGFSAMVYEVAWTRALSLVVGSSIYAFCIMLATFLGGMAIGSAWARRTLRRRGGTLAQFIWLELLLGVYGIVSLPLFSQLPQWFVTLWPATGQSFSGLSALQFLLSAVIMMVPTVAMGYLFPIVSDIVTSQLGQLGRRLGSAYAINTVGGILGSFLAGFVLIPVLGLPWAILIAGAVNLIAGAVVYIRAGQGRGFNVRRVAFASVAIVCAVVFGTGVILPTWQRQVLAAGAYLFPDSYRQTSVKQAVEGTKLLYYRDSLNATVSVHQQGGAISLKVGGKTDASNGVDMSTQVLSAHIPMLLHRDPKRVLVIGLGSGVTLGHAGRYPVSILHCAEIDPAVVEGARFFKAYNYDVHNDPRAAIYAVDGRNFLLASPTSYDVIISEPSNPWMAGVGYLFTSEFYQLAKRRLAPGGVMCQWLQLYRISANDVKLMLRTFHEAFPFVSVWSTLEGDLVLVGSMASHQPTYEELARRMAAPQIREALAVVHADRPDVLLKLFWLGVPEIRQLTADTPWVHQDDQPWLEFSAPKALYTGPVLATNTEGLKQFKANPQALVVDYDAAKEDAGARKAAASHWNFRMQLEEAREFLDEAVALDPRDAEAWVRLGEISTKTRHVLKAQEAFTRAIEHAPNDPEAYRLLARLYWRQEEEELAQRFFEQAASLRVPDEQFAEELGAYFRSRRQFPLAAEYFRSAVSQGAGAREPVVVAYAFTLKELKAWNEVERVSLFGMSAFPGQTAFSVVYGEALLEQGRLEEAQRVFREALVVAPQIAAAYYGLGRIALEHGQAEEAAHYLKTGLRYNPYYREALELLDRMQRT